MKQTFHPDTRFVGVDVASTELVVNVYGQPQTTSLTNNRSCVLAWLAKLPADAVIAVEATSNYHELLLGLAHDTGRVCYLLNPKDVRHYAKSTGARSKTDRVDAMVIARYLAKEHAHLHVWHPPSAASQTLDRLLTRRAKLINAKGAIQKSLAGLPDLKTQVGEVMNKLERLIDCIDTRIEKATKALPEGGEQATRLRTIPGIGLLTSAMLTNLFIRVPFTGADAVVAFAGLDPRANDSGHKRGRRSLSKRGPAELRRLLYNAAMSAARTKLWKPVYEHERKKHLPTTAALVILARKILRIAFALFKTQTDFDPSIIQKACAKP
jgi:transposase